MVYSSSVMAEMKAEPPTFGEDVLLAVDLVVETGEQCGTHLLVVGVLLEAAVEVGDVGHRELDGGVLGGDGRGEGDGEGGGGRGGEEAAEATERHGRTPGDDYSE